jgi:hypothetical protein
LTALPALQQSAAKFNTGKDDYSSGKNGFSGGGHGASYRSSAQSCCRGQKGTSTVFQLPRLGRESGRRKQQGFLEEGTSAVPLAFVLRFSMPLESAEMKEMKQKKKTYGRTTDKGL